MKHEEIESKNSSIHDVRIQIPDTVFFKMRLLYPGKSVVEMIEKIIADKFKIKTGDEYINTTGVKTQLEKAQDFLLAELAAGPAPSAMLIRDAALEGITSGTLRRAKETMGVQAVRKGYANTGEWFWEFPS